MSILFKKISLKALDDMQKTLAKDPDRVREACLELQESEPDDLPVTKGEEEVYSILFDLLECDVCDELRQGGKYGELMEFWQEDSDALDLILLTPELIKPLRASFSSLDFDIPTFIEDFSIEYEVEPASVSAALQTLMSAMMAAAGEALLFVAI